jgi:hypothetical protein
MTSVKGLLEPVENMELVNEMGQKCGRTSVSVLELFRSDTLSTRCLLLQPVGPAIARSDAAGHVSLANYKGAGIPHIL